VVLCSSEVKPLVQSSRIRALGYFRENSKRTRFVKILCSAEKKIQNEMISLLNLITYEGRLISLWLYKENNKLFYIFPLSSTHTYDFVVLTSVTHPRTFFWLC
jgi:hypothetical protein